jgi:triacylglycerol esterase/lipase EstA (alpha/beta hydrolase family)
MLGGLLLMQACSHTPVKTPEKKTWDEAMPGGVNQASCIPKAGKRHVFLIHGTLHSSSLSFNALAPRLSQAGYCTWARDYGVIDPKDPLKGRQPVVDSAKEVAGAIDEVLRKTGNNKIDLIGFSQGGLIGFYLLKQAAYAGKVNQLIAISPSIRGTSNEASLRFNAGGQCPACADQYAQSSFIKTFNANPLTVPGVRYTVLATRDDWIVTPPESQLVNEAGVRNFMMQDVFPGKSVSHVGMMYDDAVAGLVISLLNGDAVPGSVVRTP